MDELRKDIYKLETDLLNPEIRASMEKLDELLSDDFIEYGSSGLIYDKTIILERLPKNITPSYALYDFELLVLSETIVQTRFKTDKINTDNTITVSLRTSLWRNNGNRWQIFFHQGTPFK